MKMGPRALSKKLIYFFMIFFLFQAGHDTALTSETSQEETRVSQPGEKAAHSENPNKESSNIANPASTEPAVKPIPGIVELLMGMTMLGSEWVLWLLIILSVVSLSVVFDRMIYFFRSKIDFDAFMTELTDLLVKGREEEIANLCKDSLAVEAIVAREAVDARSLGLEAIEKGTSGYIVRVRTRMEKGLTFLGTLGNNAPFIGLFGTVLGIIQAFQDLSSNPAGGPTVVMAGISEALIATAVGLFVAIPAVIAFNWFQRSVNSKLSNAEAVQSLMLKHYSSKKNI